jgi:hypothetical protein
MRLGFGLVLAQAVLQTWTYVVPQGSPGFYHGNSTAAVTFDQHTLFLDNKRLFVFSGEFHPWRSPSGIPAWRDVLQKMKVRVALFSGSFPIFHALMIRIKAAGFNAVSVYHRWGLSEGKQGSLDFSHYRNHSALYQTAKEVGILVISRPGVRRAYFAYASKLKSLPVALY